MLHTFPGCASISVMVMNGFWILQKVNLSLKDKDIVFVKNSGNLAL